MKDWKKIFNQNKFQFFFFVSMLSLLVVALVVTAVNVPQGATNNDKPNDNIFNNDNSNTGPTKVIEIVEESLIVPLTEKEYKIVRSFYDKNATIDAKEKSLIKYNNSFRTSQGTSFQKKDGTTFNVVAALSGKVIDIKESPLLGKCVIIEHDNDIVTCYYALSEVVVKVGSIVTQKDKIGLSGYSELDSEAQNHVYFLVKKKGNYLNPETLFGKKISEI